MKVLVVVGTRPEVMKTAPVVRALRRRGARVRLAATSQHRELLRQALADFGLKADVDLRLMRRRQTPSSFLRRALPALGRLLARERPDAVLAAGDTSSVLAAALSSWRAGVPFMHVEAGLRSHDLRAPFPEEQFRVLADHLAALCFAPTALARRNLLREGVEPARALVTGNPVVDAVRSVMGPRRPAEPLVVVTLHRREAPLPRLLAALRRAADARPELTFVYPVHPRSRVRLSHPRIRLTRPLPYRDFVRLLQRCRLIVTDSGGIQEEAPTLGKPVLVMRRATERPESGARLIGFSAEKLLAGLARPPKPPRRNPYGDGRAGERIALSIMNHVRNLRRRQS